MTGAAVLVLGMLLFGACAPVEPQPAAPLPAAAPATEHEAAATGTLRMEQITVEVRDGPVRVRLTPLDDEVIRLTAPDTRHRLRALAEANRESVAADRASSAGASLFLVSFLSAEPDREFDPEALTIDAAGQRLRPARILPLTPGWGEHRLRPLAAEAAVYVFDRLVPPLQPFVIHYGARSSDAWRSVIPLLQAEQRKPF
jgi:hypothetical protein